MKRVRTIRFAALAPLLLAGCAQLPPRPSLPYEVATPTATDAPLDRMFAAAEGAHPKESAFRLVADGTEAFTTRLQSLRLARRSIDVQTYIWHADASGTFFAQELLAAADRGVHVRLLIDDMDARARNASFAALAAHPNVEVRLFNPYASRSGSLSWASESARNFQRINRRMHNKSWIVDGRIAFVGGRNIGDEYFGAGEEVNFVDLDFAMLGPVVRDVSDAFDRYWNASAAWPMELLDPRAVNDAALEDLRQKLDSRAAQVQPGPFADALRAQPASELFAAASFEWSAAYRFVVDDPNKVHMRRRDAKRAVVATALRPLLENAKRAITVISPYFVPGRRGTSTLIRKAEAGESVRVLTNSLAANDVATVHGGYSLRRRPLLEGGVQIWELKPTDGGLKKRSFRGSSGASLHTKALTADDRLAFVGSYNLDPRSTWLNCEQGVLVEDQTLAEQLGDIFKTETDGSRAWRVTLDSGHLHWSDGKEEFHSEPKASLGRRFQAWIARFFHLDAQL